MATKLQVVSVPKNTVLHQVQEGSFRKVLVSDPAISVMTDFNKGKALSVAASESMDHTNEKMIAYGVRLLFVTEDNAFIGIITSTDILGQKPVLYITERGSSRDEITAKDLMTPILALEAVRFSDLENATVGDLVETLKQSNRQHMLVLEGQESPVIRGLLSMTQISKKLGVAVRSNERANHFSDFAAL